MPFTHSPAISTSRKNENSLDIPQMSQSVLLETLERQRKLVSNKQFILKLPDKGARLLELKCRLEEEVKKREQEMSDLCTAIGGISVNGQELSESLEWEGKCHPGSSTTKLEKEEADTEGSERDPFTILSFHSSVILKKIVKQESLDPSLIKPSDLEDSEMKETSSKQHDHDLDLPEIKYLKRQCEKIDKVVVKERFVLYKPLQNCPCSKVKSLSLEDSLKAQMKQEKVLKEVQAKHAAERLKQKIYPTGDTLPPLSNSSEYRDVQQYQSDEEEAENHEEEY